VAIIQRFGGALNLNVHVHALVADGVFTVDDGRPRFWPARPATGEDIATLTAIVAQRIRALLARRGLSDDGGGVEAPDLWAEDAPVLAHLAAASVRRVAALGPRAGAPPLRADGVPW
jgi:hypothetical protein